MKHFIFKKALSLFLALIMALTLTTTAFASDEAVTPVIVVSGMNAFELLDAETKEVVFAPPMDQIMDTVGQIALPLIGSVAKNDWNIFANYGADKIGNVFKAIECDKDGNPTTELTFPLYDNSLDTYLDEIYFKGETPQSENSVLFQPNTQTGVAIGVAEQIGWENTYFFNYDWRLSPIDHADELSEMVERVKAEKNCDKVSITAISMGGDIVSAYLDKYGSDSLKNVVMGSTAFQGVSIAGELYSGNVEINFKNVMTFLSSLISDKAVLCELIGLGTDFLGKDFLGMNFEKAFDSYIAAVVDEIQAPVFKKIFIESYCAMQGMWALLPSEYYEAAKAEISSYGFLSDEFFEKTDAYNEIQKSAEKNIKDAIANGVDVYIIGSYGYMGMPLTPSATVRTDNLIDTAYMTGNCTVAPYGKTLSDIGYTSEDETGKHISSDNVIDASTAMLPEQTWVIRGMSHVDFACGSDTNKLITWLSITDESVNVDTDENFPQFVNLEDDGSFTSLTGEKEQEVELSFVEQVLAFIKTLSQKVKSVF